jgi:hypothetical protein
VGHRLQGLNNDLADCVAETCNWNGTERFNAGCK